MPCIFVFKYGKEKQNKNRYVHVQNLYINGFTFISDVFSDYVLFLGYVHLFKTNDPTVSLTKTSHFLLSPGRAIKTSTELRLIYYVMI